MSHAHPAGSVPQAMADATDEAMESAWRAGVGHALSELFRRHYRGLVAYLGRIVRDASAAEDLAQQTFVRVLERREGAGRFRSFLYTTARNLALNEVRRQGRDYVARPGLDAEPAGAASSPLEGLVRLEDRAAFARAVAGLPEEERAAFVLKEAHGLTYGEVGKALGLHPDAARRRVARAYERLRAALLPEETP